MLICHLYISCSGKFVKVIIPIYNWAFCLFVFLLLSVKSFFHILEVLVRYVFYKDFLLVCGMSFYSLDTFYCRAEIFILIKSSLSIISFTSLNSTSFGFFFSLPHHAVCGILVPRQRTEFVSPALRARNPNHWTHEEISGLSLMLSSRNFIVLCFTSKSMTHLGLIFVKGIKAVSRLLLVFFFACTNHLLQAFSFLRYIALHPLLKIK